MSVLDVFISFLFVLKNYIFITKYNIVKRLCFENKCLQHDKSQDAINWHAIPKF